MKKYKSEELIEGKLYECTEGLYFYDGNAGDNYYFEEANVDDNGNATRNGITRVLKENELCFE